MTAFLAFYSFRRLAHPCGQGAADPARQSRRADHRLRFHRHLRMQRERGQSLETYLGERQCNSKI